MHVLDETSPLAGYDAERLAADDVRLFLSIRGIDLELNAEVRDIQDYDAGRILFGKRYADAVSRDEQGRTTADLARLSWTEDDG